MFLFSAMVGAVMVLGTSGEAGTFLSYDYDTGGYGSHERKGVLMHLSHWCLLSTGVVLMVLLSGCGYNAGSGATPSPTGKPPTLPVTLQVGAASYQRGNSISVTIQNQSGHTIMFADHRTNCTVLLLERQVNGSWEPVAPCKLMLATHLHSLKTGEVNIITFTTTDQWPTGYYHARLDYSIQSNAGGKGLTPVYSSQFLLH